MNFISKLKSTKILTWIMALVFSLALLTGCGKEQPKAAAPAQVSTQEAGAQGTKSVESNGAKQGLSQQDAELAKASNGKKVEVFIDQAYTDKDHVAAYINSFAKLPHNYITKNEAKKLGWQTKGTLDKVAPGKSIGGDRFGNYENKLPQGKWKECDIDYKKGNRNAKRIVFSSNGMIYYTGDHYKTFTRLY